MVISLHHDFPGGAPSSDSSHDMGTMQGHGAWHPGVPDIGKFDYLERCILGGIDVLSLPFRARGLDGVMWITSEARTPIEFEVPINQKATAIEGVAAFEIVREEVRIIDVDVFHDIYVGGLPILGVVS